MLCICGTLSAQRSGIRVAISGLNLISESMIPSRTLSFDSPFELGPVYDKSGRPKGYGSVSIGYVYEDSKRFSFAADFQYSPFVQTDTRLRTGKASISYIGAEMFSASGLFQWSYFTDEGWFRLYGAAGPVVFWFRDARVPVILAQVNPLCLSGGGEHIRGFLEFGVGPMFTGVQLGLSFYFSSHEKVR